MPLSAIRNIGRVLIGSQLFRTIEPTTLRHADRPRRYAQSCSAYRYRPRRNLAIYSFVDIVLHINGRPGSHLVNVIELSGQRRVGVDGTTHALLRLRLANAMS